MMFRKCSLALLFLLASCLAAAAQNTVKVCVVTGASAPFLCTDVSSSNPLPVTGSITALTTVLTPISPATATATQGLMLGGQYNSSQPTFTNGQQGGLQIGARGELLTTISNGATAAAVKAASTAPAATDPALVVAISPNSPASTAPVTQNTTNPTSTLTMTSSTTAYTAGQLVASNATAGSIVVPFFAISTTAGGAMIPRLRLSTNDTTSTAWGAQTIQVDLWTAAPTFTNGDRGAWSPATGTASHVGGFTCLMSAEYGDGAYAECSPNVGTFALLKLASGTSVFWTLNAITGSGVTGASKVFTLTAEVMN